MRPNCASIRFTASHLNVIRNVAMKREQPRVVAQFGGGLVERGIDVDQRDAMVMDKEPPGRR